MLSFIICFFMICALRIIYLVTFKGKKPLLKKQVQTLVVIGSGGHTLEMIKLVKSLNPKLYCPRLYVMADSDTSSENKIKELEADFQKCLESEYDIVKIPRSRKVNQNYASSVFTTLYSILSCIPVVFKFKPDVILCNGPGTCIPICVLGFLINAFLFSNIKIVFVESICRVQTLSLSGKILLYFADVIIVQWEKLQRLYPQTVYLGRLV